MNEKIIVTYKDRDNSYDLTLEDMDRVDHYCENECLGIQFLISANTLRELVAVASQVGLSPPFTVGDLVSAPVRAAVESGDLSTKVDARFGVDDYALVVPLVIKQTYNFLFKL